MSSGADTQVFRIKLSTHAPYVLPAFELVRQTPGKSGRWQEFSFAVNEPTPECSAWFIYDGLVAPEQTLCPPENVVFITAEPPAYKVYPKTWLRQFPRVLGCDRKLAHRQVHFSQTALPWFVNKSYDELAGDFPVKTKALSMICSRKKNMRGHRRRLAFEEHLKQAGLPDIDFFGRGKIELADKWNGLAPYRYSIALENSRYPDYWTEKVADCFLAGTVPVYCGCPNLGDYFPSGAFAGIDWRDFEASAQTIRQLLAADDYPARLPALRQARDLVLNRYNLFHVIAECCRTLDLHAPRQPVRLAPEPAPGDWVRRWYKWRRRYWA
jgi:hypothetical protein